MPSLNRNEKVTFDNCGTQTTKLNLACHKKRCSVGTLYCTQCPNFSTKFQKDLKYHNAKKHSPQNLISSSSVNFVIKSFQEFTLYVNIETQHGIQIRSKTRDMDVEHIVGENEDHKLREEMRSCQHFLVDSELERAKHKVFNYAVETLNKTIVNKKLDHFFNKLKCAAKMKLAFGIILKIIEDGGFRFFNAHEKNTISCNFPSFRRQY